MSAEERSVLHKDRKKWSPSARNIIWLASGKKCFYCKDWLEITEMTVDHMVPIGKGGADDITNAVSACKLCNTVKGDLHWEDFLKRGGRGKRTIPYGYRAAPATLQTIKYRMQNMGDESRTRDILTRVLNGERVDFSKYPEKISPTRGYDKLVPTMRKYAKKFPMIRMEGAEIWMEPYDKRNGI